MIGRVITFCLLIALFLATAFPAYPKAAGYTVQVGACDRQANAAAMINELETKGFTAYIHEAEDRNGKALYQVRLEDFALKAAAVAAADKYMAQTGEKAVVKRIIEIAAGEKPNEPATIADSSNADRGQPKEAAPVVETAKPQDPLPSEDVVPPLEAVLPEDTTPPAVPEQAETEDTVKPEEAASLPQDESSMDSSQPVQPMTKTESDIADGRMQALEMELEALRQEINRFRDQREARRKLEITDEEKASKEKEILSAAGREYTTMKKNTVGIEYNFNYQYYSYDVITEATSIESHANHNLTNSLFFEYALLQNLTLNFNLPFSYKWDRTGTEDSRESTELGDVSVGFQYQPLRSGGALPTTILYGSFSLNTGRSPYEINVDEDMSTGSGYYVASAGLSFSKTIDPVIAFGNIGYTYNFEPEDVNQTRSNYTLTDVDPGDAISGAIGMGLALSYNVSMNFSYQYSYRFSTTYSWAELAQTESGSQTSSIFYIGTGWRFSPKYSLNMKVGIGMTDDDPDFIVSFRIPFEFSLAD